MPGWLKINFDGARKADGPKAGAGFVCRNAEGTLIAAAAAPSIDKDVNAIELAAAWSALHWICNKTEPCAVWLEGDSKYVVDLLNQEPQPSDNPILADCKIYLSKLETSKVSHIHREGNAGADFMANIGCMVAEYTLWESNFPAELASIVERDALSFFRQM